MSKAIRDILDDYDSAVAVLRDIARGRADCGRPLPAEKARQMAREVCIRLGEEWDKGKRVR